MGSELIPAIRGTADIGTLLPALISREGQQTSKRFLEFFTVNIRNPNTRLAYAKGVGQFLAWCDERRQGLQDIEPVLSAADARRLLDSIETGHVVGLRDRALIGLMVYSFARVSAVVKMRVGDYYPNGKRYWIRLHEKGGKFHEVPVHHTAEEYLDAYVDAAGIAGEKNKPLFRTTRGKTRELTERALDRFEAHKMIKRRAGEAGLPAGITCHTFRATGITAYLENGGTIEHAQQIAAHESPRTTKLYDRTSDAISLDEIERIVI